MPTLNFDRARATKKQINYILQLIVDLGFTIRQRDQYIAAIVGRETKPDGLFFDEAGKVIDKFRGWLGRDDA